MEQVKSTHDLLDKISRGDESAFTSLFERYQKRLALLIHYKLSPELRRLTEVEDVLQETFLEAFRDIKQFRYENPGGFFGWLSRIAQPAARATHRRNSCADRPDHGTTGFHTEQRQ